MMSRENAFWVTIANIVLAALWYTLAEWRADQTPTRQQTFVLCERGGRCPGRPKVADEAVAQDRDGRSLGAYACTREDSVEGRAAMGVCLAVWKGREPTDLFAIEDPRGATALAAALADAATRADPLPAETTPTETTP